MLFVTLKETQGLTAQSCSNQKLVTEQKELQRVFVEQMSVVNNDSVGYDSNTQISEVHSDAFFTEWYCSPGPETGKCATG